MRAFLPWPLSGILRVKTMSTQEFLKGGGSQPAGYGNGVLYEAIRALTSELSLEVVLQKVANLSKALVEAQYSVLGVINENGEISQFITSGVSASARRRIGKLPQGRGVLGVVLREGKSLRLTNLAEHPESVGFPKHHPQMSSFLGVPLVLKGRVIGNLYLTNKTSAQEFTPEDETLVTLFANQAAVAIENARLFQSERTALTKSREAMAERNRAEEAQRESEKQFKDVLDNTTAVIYIKDTQGRYMFINRSYENLFHVNRDKIRGKTDYDVFPADIADVLRANDRRVLDAGSHLEREEVIPQDDGLHTYISTKFLLYDTTGSPYAVCGISTDITERKETERHLAVAEERERIGRDLHDGVIQSIYAVGLGLEDLSERVMKHPKEAKNRINQTVEDLNQVIRDIRSYIMELRPRELQGRRFDQALGSLINYLKERTGVLVDFRSSMDLSDLPERYVVNLWHIFQESFSNVEKYAQATQVNISLTVRDGYLTLVIFDNGVGFELEQAEGGRGYGLSSIKDRSERLGGMLEINTAPGKGTQLNVRIPYHG